MPGVVSRLEPALVRERPDLEKVDLFGGVPVVFAVADASSSASHLQVASLHDLEVAYKKGGGLSAR